MLTDLARAARDSGLRVVELPGWDTNRSGGDAPGDGVLVHHTGAYDAMTDARNDREYAEWMARRTTHLDPPICNLALSAEAVVYVCAAGNANHAGAARASGPMPAASDGNALYIGIEAMNSGSQGWDSTGTDADGHRITQYEAYVRLCAALCRHYGWPASHVRAHRETSVTGKWDPGGIDMDDFRADVARLIDNPRTSQEDDMPTPHDVWTEPKFDDPQRVVKDGQKKSADDQPPIWFLQEILRNQRQLLREAREDEAVSSKEAHARIEAGIDPDGLADAIVAKLPKSQQIDRATVKAGVLDALKEGTN